MRLTPAAALILGCLPSAGALASPVDPADRWRRFDTCVHDSLERVRKDAAGCERKLGATVLRGETFTAQVSVRANEALARVTAKARGDLPTQLFVEHFVDVPARSRTGLGLESLGFTAEARGDDRELLGQLPDALVPVEDAAAWLYPASVATGERAVFFLEAYVPEDEQRPFLTFEVEVMVDGAPRTVSFEVEVAPRVLPFRAAKALAYYEYFALERAFAAAAPDVERSLVQLLHAHGLDAFTRVTTAAEAARVRGAFDGSWFDPARGYRGPGAGQPAEVFILGAYGRLDDPTDPSMDAVRAILAEVPAGPALALYAVDETCDSPRGAVWRARLDEAGLDAVRVLHTCHTLPATQPVDIVAMPGQSFDPDLAEEARARGKEVWVYNGQLPHTGAPNLDVPLASLTHDGWLAALHDVGRWFYWETVFWEDIYKGGKGPHDPFATAETFHNAHGDVSLYDGLLVFPGRVPSAVGSHDLGRDAVYPSLRLKALRRGLEDAALLALAAQVDVTRTHEVARRVIAAGFDEVDPASEALFSSDPLRLATARRELREIILSGVPGPTDGLAALRTEHRDHRFLVGAGQPPVRARWVPMVVMPIALLGLGLALVLLLEAARPGGARRR